MVGKLLLRSLVAERHRHAESRAHMRPQVPGVPGLTRYLDPGLQQRAVSRSAAGRRPDRAAAAGDLSKGWSVAPPCYVSRRRALEAPTEPEVEEEGS